MYIPIEKLGERSGATLYAFRVDELGWVRFWFDRASGKTHLADGEAQAGVFEPYLRAAGRVRDLYARGLEPERTAWAG